MVVFVIFNYDYKENLIMTSNMRKEWFEHVKKTRVKMNRVSKDKTVTHREAMKAASDTWAEAKAKIERANKRKERKVAKEKQSV